MTWCLLMIAVDEAMIAMLEFGNHELVFVNDCS